MCVLQNKNTVYINKLPKLCQLFFYPVACSSGINSITL